MKFLLLESALIAVLAAAVWFSIEESTEGPEARETTVTRQNGPDTWLQPVKHQGYWDRKPY